MTNPLTQGLWRALVFCFLVEGCDSNPAQETAAGAPVKTAELGVFYGGQVQERERVERVLEQVRQSFGFRLIFDKPLNSPLRVKWEVDKPIGKKRVIELGQTTARAGMDRLDQVLPFSNQDGLGIYNVRVHVDHDLVIDRAVLVVDP